MTIDANKENQTARTKRIVGKVLLYAVLIIASLLLLFPFYVMVTTSFKTFAEATGAFTFFPKEWVVDSYKEVLFTSPLGIDLPKAFLNTLIIAVPTTLVGVFVSSMSAFIFAKYKFFGRDIGFSLLLFTMMIPGAITMMPQFLIFSQMGWTDTRLPLMIPGMFGSAMCVFFMRQYIRGIPTELVESASLDGMGKFRTFVTIILPLSMPALISQFILLFIGSYNDYLGPLMYLQTRDKYTLQIMLASFQGMSATAGGRNVPNIMAGSVLSMLPLLIIYVFTQKFFISGIAVSGLKA